MRRPDASIRMRPLDRSAGSWEFACLYAREGIECGADSPGYLGPGTGFTMVPQSVCWREHIAPV